MVNHHRHHYAVLMAGGSGTRLWPMSRKDRPKQFQALVSSQSLLQIMYELLRENFPAKRIFIQTGRRFAEIVEKQLPELPAENRLYEPEARDNAPAFCLAVASILDRDPEAKIGFFWTDHIIKNKSSFNTAIRLAYQAIEDFPQEVVMVGVKPTYPHTGLGYMRMGSEAKVYPEGKVFQVKEFIEKPDLKTAQKMLKSWEYFWNTGYRIYHGTHFLEFLTSISPQFAQALEKMQALLKKGNSEAEIDELYRQLPKVSIDVLMNGKKVDILGIPSDMEWSDIGDWKTLHDILSDRKGHQMISKGNYTGVDCENCLVYAGERLVATLGLKDIIVVDTGDVVLVANKHQVQDLKKLITRLEEQDKHLYL